MTKETMTSRERVIRTLNRETVDRYPIDLGCHMSTGISAFTYRHLREHLGLEVDVIDMPDVVQGLARIDLDVMERFHVDCILLEPRWQDPVVWNPRGDYKFSIPAAMNPQRNIDGEWVVEKNGARMRMPNGGFFFDGAWLSGWGPSDIDEIVKLYAVEAERLYKETPYALNFLGYSMGVGFPGYLGGVEHAVDMIIDPEGVLQAHEQWFQNSIILFDKVNKAFGEYIQMVSVADDMGAQNGPLCNPSLVEEFSIPFYKRFCDHVHANSDIKVFMHNCGSIKPLIPMLIHAGIDILNPVQISADNMDPYELKREFGDDIIFWGGGCDTQHVLPSAGPDEVAEHVRGLIQAFKPGGGFVFNQVHNITGNIPPENIVAMFDTAYSESFY
ncbi:MAG: uroporphyrinogen decarboxylase family protein [Armatimonadota bacterium]